MASVDELKNVRLKKLEALRAAGMNPYPSSVPRDTDLATVRGKFVEFSAHQKPISLAGRVVAIRGQGAILFVVLQEGADKFQAVFKRDDMDEKLFSLFTETADMGDFISVTGTLFTTERGEPSILVKDWTMASKSLLPLPEKWHGLQDEDEKLRKRYLDILLDADLRALFEKKALFWESARAFMKSEGYLEIETPTIEVTTGGAEARPFKTHHNDFDMDVYMRISVGELWQKRALAAGFPKVFEIGRVYRNEGSSPEHLQEFTNMECYGAYMDYRAGMDFVERMVKDVVEKTFGTLTFDIKGFNVDLSKKWEVIEYVPYVEKITGVNVLTDTDEKLSAALEKLGVVFEGNTRERMVDSLWKYCRKTIAGPVWLIHHPKLISPLAKSVPENPDTVERCQLIMAGSEFCNSFSELNDPVDQDSRFKEQQTLIERGDEEAMMPDFEFVEMLEHGMPPAFGSAPLGDRLFAVLAGRPIRDTVLFPLVKPRTEN